MSREGKRSLDERRLHELAAEAGSTDIVAELTEIFIADVGARLEALRKLAMGSESDEVRRNAHALQGACSSIGAMKMASLGRHLETLAAPSNPAEFRRTLDDLDAEFDRVCVHLGRLSGKLPRPSVG